ncbi:hypothetical protein PCE1_002766 [Barthelona sp. PCE]
MPPIDHTKTQIKAFTGWINTQLGKKGQFLNDIKTDFADGKFLCLLVEVLLQKPCPPPNDVVKREIHGVENLNHALECLQDPNFNPNPLKIRMVSAEDFISGERSIRQILGFIWTLILKIEIQEITEEEKSAKEGLLLWCKRACDNYAECTVENFHRSWQSGYAFNALIHHHKPELIDYAGLPEGEEPEKCKERLIIAFNAAKEHLGIPEFFEVDDIVDVDKPDDRSMMTYISQFFHAFASERKATRGRGTVKRFLMGALDALKAGQAYNDRCGDLKEWVDAIKSYWTEKADPESLSEVQTVLKEFRDFRSSEERTEKMKEKLALEAYIVEIANLRRAANLPPFTPVIEPDELKKGFVELEEVETKLAVKYRESLIKFTKLDRLVGQITQQRQRISGFIDALREFIETDVENKMNSIRSFITMIDTKEAEIKRTNPVLEEVGKLVEEYEALEPEQSQVPKQKHFNLVAELEMLTEKLDSRKTELHEMIALLEEKDKLSLEFSNKLNETLRWINHRQDSINAIMPSGETSVAQLKILEPKLDAESKLLTEGEAMMKELEEMKERMTTLEIEKDGAYATVSYDVVVDRFTILKAFFEQRTDEFNHSMQGLVNIELLSDNFMKELTTFDEWADDFKQKLEKLSSKVFNEPESVLEKLSELNVEKEAKAENLEHLVNTYRKLSDQGVDLSDKTASTDDSIAMIFETVSSIIEHDIRSCENAIKIKESSNLSEDQLKELTDNFHHFDADNSGSLLPHELKACLSAMGEEISDEEVEKLVADVEKGMPVDSFITLMTERQKVKDSPEDVLEAFGLVANGTDFVTKQQLVAAMGEEMFEEMLPFLPPYEGVEDAYDFNAFAKTMFQV